MAEHYYIVHSGLLGMKWGKRRYQNYDGTLTEEGKRRYYKNYNPDHRELLKKQAILRGDISEVQNNKDYFSRQEKQELLENYRKNKEIDDVYAAIIQRAKGKNKVEKMFDMLDKMEPKLRTAVNVAQDVDKLVKLFKGKSNEDEKKKKKESD